MKSQLTFTKFNHSLNFHRKYKLFNYTWFYSNSTNCYYLPSFEYLCFFSHSVLFGVCGRNASASILLALLFLSSLPFFFFSFIPWFNSLLFFDIVLFPVVSINTRIKSIDVCSRSCYICVCVFVCLY